MTVKDIITDNELGYIPKIFRKACAALNIRHIRKRPYNLRTNGKAKRFIQIILKEWVV